MSRISLYATESTHSRSNISVAILFSKNQSSNSSMILSCTCMPICQFTRTTSSEVTCVKRSSVFCQSTWLFSNRRPFSNSIWSETLRKISSERSKRRSRYNLANRLRHRKRISSSCTRTSVQSLCLKNKQSSTKIQRMSTIKTSPIALWTSLISYLRVWDPIFRS